MLPGHHMIKKTLIFFFFFFFFFFYSCVIESNPFVPQSKLCVIWSLLIIFSNVSIHIMSTLGQVLHRRNTLHDGALARQTTISYMYGRTFCANVRQQLSKCSLGTKNTDLTHREVCKRVFIVNCHSSFSAILYYIASITAVYLCCICAVYLCCISIKLIIAAVTFTLFPHAEQR